MGPSSALRGFMAVGLLALLTACSGSGSAASCEQVADNATATIQEFVDGIGDVSLTEADPEELQSLQESLQGDLEDLDSQAQAACDSEEQFVQLIGERLNQVEAQGEVGELFLEGLRGEFTEG